MSGDHTRSTRRGSTRRQVVARTTAAAASFAIPPFAYAQDGRSPVHIKSSEVVLEGDKALIDNKSLSDVVTNNKAAALTDLHEVFPSLQANQVSLDKDGRIVITNEDAAKKLKAFVESNRAAQKDAQDRQGATLFDNCTCVDVRCK
jgi:hypothetical protein